MLGPIKGPGDELQDGGISLRHDVANGALSPNGHHLDLPLRSRYFCFLFIFIYLAFILQTARYNTAED